MYQTFSTYLKIKIKSLAAESKIIRREENGKPVRLFADIPRKSLLRVERKQLRAERQKHRHNEWYGLHRHRIFDVRQESRVAFIAYGFLRGRAYKEIENNPHWLVEPHDRPKPDFNRVVDLILKFGPALKMPRDIIKNQVAEWVYNGTETPYQRQRAEARQLAASKAEFRTRNSISGSPTEDGRGDAPERGVLGESQVQGQSPTNGARRNAC